MSIDATSSQAPPAADHRHGEHPPPKVQPLDMEFPYDTIKPVEDQKNLNFFLTATKSQTVEELKSHARKIQEEAYAIWSYPCIRRWAFLTTKAAKATIYPHVLTLHQDDPDAIYLDTACFTGTDSRKVAMDGWPVERIVGTDLRNDWFELGYKLYKDRDTCKIKFIAGDIFDSTFLNLESSSSPSSQIQELNNLTPLIGRVRAISAFSFFHLFDEDAQFELAKRMAKLLKPVKGSVIFGSHQGMPVAGMRDRRDNGGELWGHSPSSWADLWETVIYPASRKPEGEPGPRVKVTAELRPDGLDYTRDPSLTGNSRLMQWSVVVL